jgi:hypothetical protein
VLTPDAAIVVFRGTSTEGTATMPLADHLADWNDAPQLVNVDGVPVCVHEGFWGAASSVYPEIRQHMQAARADGRKIWVTGHSLGGAVATLTALRLHYDDGITVQGLQTFGSPKVGDGNMADLFDSPNVDGRALWDATIRWVVDGDPVTTFFEKELAPLAFGMPLWVYYEHVGTTHTIYALDTAGYEVKYDTGEDEHMLWDGDGLFNEHSWYLDALTFEMSEVLTAFGEAEILDQILQTP